MNPAVSLHVSAQSFDHPREAAGWDSAHHIRRRRIRDNARDWVDADAAVKSDERIIGRHNERWQSNPPGKLADAELHFTDGALEGLKLIGFAIWERRSGGGRNVTFPARQYVVNGDRRSFALLRPITDTHAQERVRDLVLQAYAEHEENATEAAS